MRKQIRLISSTISKEILIAVTNLSVALFLARQFQPLLFVDFSTIMLIVSSLTQINRGVQYSVLAGKLVEANNFENKKLSLSTIIIIEVFLWTAIAPLLSRGFDLPLIAVLVAAIAFPTTIISACVAGEFQQSFRFESWQTWLTITSLCQIPFIFFGVIAGANLSFFVLTAFVPTLFSSLIVHRSIRGQFRNSAIFISESLTKGLYIALLFLNYNLVFFLLKFLVIGDDLGKFSLVTYPLSALVGISSLFGSYKLGDSIGNGKHPRPEDLLKTFSLIFAFMQVAALFVYSFGPLIFPKLLGSNYGIDFGLLDTFLAASAYSFWGFAYWLTQSQLHKIGKPILFSQALFVCVEFSVLFFAKFSPIAIFMAHGVFGAMVVCALLWAIYSDE